jgi:hypothetical protein
MNTSTLGSPPVPGKPATADLPAAAPPVAAPAPEPPPSPSPIPAQPAEEPFLRRDFVAALVLAGCFLVLVLWHLSDFIEAIVGH